MTPRLPGKSRREREQAQQHGTWLAMTLVLVCVSGFLGIISLVLPDIFMILLVVAGFFFFIAFHYFTWGQWLTRRLLKQQQDSEE